MTQQENGPRGEGHGEQGAGHEGAGAPRSLEDLTTQELLMRTSSSLDSPRAAADASPGTDRPELEEVLERVSGTEGCEEAAPEPSGGEDPTTHLAWTVEESDEPMSAFERMVKQLDAELEAQYASYASRRTDTPQEAEVEVRFVPRRKDQAESAPAEPLPEIDPEGYVLYTDHMGWVILPTHVHEEMEVIWRALRADTWGEFLDQLPEGEREDVIAKIEDQAGPDIVPWSEERLQGVEEDKESEGEDWDEEAYFEDYFCRSTGFGPESVPGYMDGDWPEWPAEMDFVEYRTDGVCLLVYERFGKREAGFIHTSYHIDDERIDEAEAWLRSIGAKVERR